MIRECSNSRSRMGVPVHRTRRCPVAGSARITGNRKLSPTLACRVVPYQLHLVIRKEEQAHTMSALVRLICHKHCVSRLLCSVLRTWNFLRQLSADLTTRNGWVMKNYLSLSQWLSLRTPIVHGTSDTATNLKTDGSIHLKPPSKHWAPQKLSNIFPMSLEGAYLPGPRGASEPAL